MTRILRVRKTREDQIFDLIVGILSFCFLIVAAYPLYLVIIASISDPTAVSQGKVLFAPIGFSLRGYSYIFQNQDIWMGYANTILYTV